MALVEQLLGTHFLPCQDMEHHRKVCIYAKIEIYKKYIYMCVRIYPFMHTLNPVVVSILYYIYVCVHVYIHTYLCLLKERTVPSGQVPRLE